MATGASWSGDWRMHARPFRHLRVSDVVDEDRYRELCRTFAQLRHDGYFNAGAANYDAEIMALTPDLAARFAPFVETPWLRRVADALGVPFHPVIDGALHSCPAGSRTGWIHTDLCSAWFDERTRGDGLFFPNRGACDYFSGCIKDESAKPVAYARAAALIYYLCNDGWAPGAGGETGLYASAHAAREPDMARVPPWNNTLLAFECSPHSYHRFLHNPGIRRNSLILWLHLPRDEAALRWPRSFDAPKASS